jgi:hypothetical protein
MLGGAAVFVNQRTACGRAVIENETNGSRRTSFSCVYYHSRIKTLGPRYLRVPLKYLSSTG